MAIQVPIIEREQSQGNFRPMQLAKVDTPMPDFSGQTKLFDTVKGVLQQAKDRGDLTQITAASKAADDWEATNIFSAEQGALARKGKDAIGLPKFLVEKYDKDMRAIHDGLSNQEQRDAFNKELVRRRDSVQRTLFNHERTEMEGFADGVTGAKIETSKNRAALYYNQPVEVEASIEAAKAAARTRAAIKGISNEAIEADLTKIESNARLAVLTRMSDNDPKGAIDFYSSNAARFTADDLLAAQRLMTPTKRKYDATKFAREAIATSFPKTEANDIVEYVMEDIEGGDEVVIDNNGYEAKWGLNKKWNPDLDFKTLDKETAKQHYIGEYYIAVGADKLPADMRLVAFDAAVNHGVPKTKEMIAEADGDVRKFMELRRAEYDRLNKTGKKEYTDSYKGWISRLAKINKQVDTLRGSSLNEKEIKDKIDSMTGDIDTARQAKELVDQQIKTIADARKAKEAEASDEAWKYTNSNMPVPPAVEARMNPEEVAAMRNRSNVDAEFVNEVKNMILVGAEIDLKEYRWQLGGKYEELVELQGDPSKRANSRTVNDVITSNMKILIGKTSPSTAGEYQRVEAFERRVNEEIETLQKTTGKTAGPDDAQKIVDKLMLKMDSGSFWKSNKHAFELPRGKSGEVQGIPNDFDYFVGEDPLAYDDLVSSLISQVRKRGLPVNNENVLKMFKQKFTDQELTRVPRN